MKNKVYSGLLAVAVSLSTVSCEDPCDTKLLCDLAFDVASFTNPTISIAEPLIMQTVLRNVAEECEVQKAEESYRGISAKYRPDANQPWSSVAFQDSSKPNQTVYRVVPNTPNKALEKNQTDTKSDSYGFDTPGIYEFEVKADEYNRIAERNENNNIAATNNNGSLSGRVQEVIAHQDGQHYQLTVYVYDPTGKVKPNYNHLNEPTVVRYLGSK